MRFCTPSIRHAIECGDAALRLPGKGAGSTGPPLPPGRFARPPYLRAGGTPVRSCAFFSTAPAATFLWQDKEKWGPESPGNLPPPSRRAAAQI